MDLKTATHELIVTGQQLYAMGMLPATSGNISARLDDGTLAITVSGSHKGKLGESDIMSTTLQGVSLDDRRPSAETLLHTQIYARYPEAGFVLHPHSVNATVLSRLCDDALLLEDYEILKAFPDIDTHESSVSLAVFDNDQDIARLASQVDQRLQGNARLPGYLIRGHGFYTWGRTVKDALRHVEALEFLFECELQMRRMKV